MSIRLMSAAWDADLPPMEKLVLLALADCANDQGGCWPAVSTLVRKSGQGERTVRRCIGSLIKKGHITQKQRDGTSPIYTVHPCQSGTPANPAPLPERPDTPARAAPKSSRTIKASEAKASKAKPAQKKFIRPDDIPQQPWTDFIQMRQRIGKPMTERAKELAVSRLRKLAEDGWPPGDVLNHSTLNSYQGLFPPRTENDRRTNRMAGHQSTDGLSSTARAALAVFGSDQTR